MPSSKSVSWDSTPDDIVDVWLDSPDRPVNVLDEDMLTGLEALLDFLSYHDQTKAVVIRSRKPNCFVAGADIHVIARLSNTDLVHAIVRRGQELMQRWNDLTVPTLAVIDGACLGGGLELALACTYRIATDSVQTKFGAPEIRLGLIPAWGGTQRLPKRIGIQRALKMILKGSSISASKAKQYGLVDAVVESSELENAVLKFRNQFREEANRKSWLTQNSRNASTNWKDWLIDHTWPGRWLAIHLAQRSIASQRRHYPAAEKAIQAIGLAFDSYRDGFQFERESFAELLFTPTAQSLVGLFLQRDRARNRETWLGHDEHFDLPPIQRLVVVGAGAMGAGIGAVAAINGIHVTFKEIDDAAAAAGTDRVNSLLQNQLQHNQISSQQKNETMQRLEFTTQWEDIADCDLAIEAVLEIETVKRDVFKNLDHWAAKHALLASNTSSLKVSRLATVTERSQKVAGLHFFNPVLQMELVEIVRSPMTDPSTVAQLLTLVRTMGKTPIITADQPGFLVNRILFPYLSEAIRMIAEGNDVPSIDRELKHFGMPMGPLELIDTVGVDIASHVANSLSILHPDDDVPTDFLNRMLELKWLGKKSGIGFYRWGERRKSKQEKTANNEMHQANSKKPDASQTKEASIQDDQFNNDGLTYIQRRLIYPMLNEAVHCLDQQVVDEPWMVDLAMTLGTGFAPMYGGPLRLIDRLGTEIVLNNLQFLETNLGQRFSPAAGLISRGATGEPFFHRENTAHRLHGEPLQSS